MAKKSVFESAVCGRCCGSGSYSYCTMHGSVCFGCGGKGYKLTKRGAKAADFLNNKLSVKASEIKVGDLIRYLDFFKNSSYFCKVAKIEVDELNKGALKFELERGGKVVCSYGVYPDMMLRKGHSAEFKAAAIKEALAFEASLDKNGKPLKKAKECT